MATDIPDIFLSPFLVGLEGIEPTTNGLKVRCATVAPQSYGTSGGTSFVTIILHLELGVNLLDKKVLICPGSKFPFVPRSF